MPTFANPASAACSISTATNTRASARISPAFRASISSPCSIPAIPNLSAIPTGPLPPNPADLLSSHRLADAITELRTKFKFIVIDTPPVMAATDAVILSVKADGVVMVVRSGETPKEAFTRTRDLLMSVKCRLLGVVLNAVDSSAPDYYYSYRYYPYSYGYGAKDSAPDAHSDATATSVTPKQRLPQRRRTVRIASSPSRPRRRYSAALSFFHSGLRVLDSLCNLHSCPRLEDFCDF